MRVVSQNKHTVVFSTDEPGEGGAHHEYMVSTPPNQESKVTSLGNVHFQKGPIKEAGINGVTNEDLIAMVLDRLKGFQSGQYACSDNAVAIQKLEESLMWLNKRTLAREVRGVEGTNVV